jgi:hypothetical protein
MSQDEEKARAGKEILKLINGKEEKSDNKQQKQQPNSQYSHPVYKKISAANGRINRMPQKDLVEALEYLSLSSK